jgi:hypothetical protein
MRRRVSCRVEYATTLVIILNEKIEWMWETISPVLQRPDDGSVIASNVSMYLWPKHEKHCAHSSVQYISPRNGGINTKMVFGQERNAHKEIENKV